MQDCWRCGPVTAKRIFRCQSVYRMLRRSKSDDTTTLGSLPTLMLAQAPLHAEQVVQELLDLKPFLPYAFAPRSLEVQQTIEELGDVALVLRCSDLVTPVKTRPTVFACPNSPSSPLLRCV